MMVICRFPAADHSSQRGGNTNTRGRGNRRAPVLRGSHFKKHCVSDSVKLELQFNVRLEMWEGIAHSLGGHSVLKWAVTGGHDSALIAGADHTLHL